MSEQKAINLSQDFSTVESIHNDLVSLGIRNGDSVLVHASLSSMGWVSGGVQAVIIALIQAVGESGTLAMPAHSSAISDPAEWANPPVPKEWIERIHETMPAFDVNLSPTRGMGVIAELFRTLPASIRSNHPQVSFSARGKHSIIITETHPLTPQFGMNSPLGKLYNLNAKVLLIGVGFDSCSCIHLAEALNSNMPRKTMGAAILENNNRIWRWFEDFDYDSELDFEQIGKEFTEDDHVSIGNIGVAASKLFDLKANVDFADQWLQKNRFISEG